MIMNEELQLRSQKVAASKAASVVYAMTRFLLRVALYNFKPIMSCPTSYGSISSFNLSCSITLKITEISLKFSL